MAFAQNTITSANPAADLVAVLNTQLLAAGWTQVEEHTPSGTFRNRVYKSSGLANLCGYDWYLVVMWNTVGAGEYLRVIAAEQYDEVTNIASRICGPSSIDDPTSAGGYGGTKCVRADGSLSSTTINAATLATSAALLTLSSNILGATVANTPPGFQTRVPSSAFGYWMSVTLDHVALWTTTASDVISAVISTLLLDADAVAEGIYSDSPIVCWSQSSVSAQGSFQISSHLVTGVDPISSTYVAASATFSGPYGAQLPALSDPYLDAYAWQPYVYLNYMDQAVSGTTAPETQLTGLATLGRVPDFLFCWGGAMGDTIDVDLATYVLTGPLVNGWNPRFRPTAALLVE